MINLLTIQNGAFGCNKSYTIRRFLFLVLTFVLSLPAMAQQPFMVPANSKDSIYPFVRYVSGRDSMGLTNEEFFDDCAKIIFPVNKYVLPKNDPILRVLEKDVLPRLNKDSSQLVGILIRGAASPEGPYQWNQFLGERRAKALTDFVNARLVFKTAPDALDVNVDSAAMLLHQESVTEDYLSLCVAMKNAGDPNYNYVKDICDHYLAKNDEKQLKKVLMKVKGGRLWHYLLNKYYPQLRAARFMLFFRQRPEIVTDPTIVREMVIPTVRRQAWLPVPELSVLPSEEVLLRKKLLAVKTNLLLWGAYIPGYNRWAPIPNIAIEYYPLKGHFTWGASFDMPWYQDYKAHKYFQFRNYQVEGRYYPKGAKRTSGTNEATHEYNRRAYTGFYLQAYAHAAIFGICFDENRGWVGEGAGGGIGLGYVQPLCKSGHWRLELGVQAGFFRCKYDPYQYENPVNEKYRDHLYYYKWTNKPELFKKRQYRWNWIGPTRVGITLSYDLLYRRVQQKGISLKSFETYWTNKVNEAYEGKKERRAYE